MSRTRTRLEQIDRELRARIAREADALGDGVALRVRKRPKSAVTIAAAAGLLAAKLGGTGGGDGRRFGGVLRRAVRMAASSAVMQSMSAGDG